MYGYDGNDEFYVDDTTVIVTLDGGEGYDKFQIGQIFGTKRDQFGIENPATPVEDPPANPIDDGGTLLPHDTFPVLIATTRGWLSPGTHAPMVVTGGTGNDEFIVYSNQAELRLEGGDDNDLFIVRAFADRCRVRHRCQRRRRVRPLRHRPRRRPRHAALPGRPECRRRSRPDAVHRRRKPRLRRRGMDGFRLDNNPDGTCNNADAHMTGAPNLRRSRPPT